MRLRGLYAGLVASRIACCIADPASMASLFTIDDSCDGHNVDQWLREAVAMLKAGDLAANQISADSRPHNSAILRAMNNMANTFGTKAMGTWKSYDATDKQRISDAQGLATRPSQYMCSWLTCAKLVGVLSWTC